MEPTPSSGTKARNSVARGDPKSFDIGTVQHRLMSQSTSNAMLIEKIASVIPLNSGGFIEVKAGSSSFPDFDPITALQAGLIAEMNVCIFTALICIILGSYIVLSAC